MLANIEVLRASEESFREESRPGGWKQIGSLAHAIGIRRIAQQKKLSFASHLPFRYCNARVHVCC